MQFPESWLREFCDPAINTQQLADVLTMAGLEVEEIRPVAPSFNGVVVGKIIDAVQHPDADRLRICNVDVGAGAPLQIVCGAPNARPGISVPCATVGAILPPGPDGKPFRIKVGKLRGVESHGMLCSGRELGLGNDEGGLLELDGSVVPGADIRTALQLDDVLFTLKLTPNLAHCLSIHGVARELSALTGAPLRMAPAPVVTVSTDAHLRVTINAPDLCGRFSGRVVTGVNPKARTPAWMVDRLSRCGQRSVSALVDISNYVMFEFGQPTHIFDRDRINGDSLTVRWATPDESLKLLNGSTVKLDSSVGVIADAQGVESLAGIMGGDATSVTDDTRNIYIESAFWYPQAVAGRSRRFNFSTDAGHRFERGVDPAGTVEHLERITALVLSICGGSAGPVADHQPAMPVRPRVRVRVERAARVLGMPLDEGQCENALRALGFDPEQVGDAAHPTLEITAPSWRFDLTIEEDLIEEIARVIGFDHLPTTPPLAPITPRLRAENERGPFEVRRMVAARGYQETINFSFVDERWERELVGNTDPIRLMNPIASQMSVMRSSLLGSLLQVVKFNTDRKMMRVRAFEIGRVFLRDPDTQDSDTTVAGFDQPMRIAGAAYGPVAPLQWGQSDRDVDFFEVKGDVEALLSPAVAVFEPVTHPALHPGRSARVLLDGRRIGVIGELHPRWRQSWGFAGAPVLFELDLKAVLAHPVPAPLPVARQQDVERDIAVVVAEAISFGAVQGAMQSASTDGLLRQSTLFDIYRPRPGAPANSGLESGEKSLAIRLIFNGGDLPLDDARIDKAVQAVIEQLSSQLGARLRT
jgi:phenylalanyl-tRNA synthetase beta chain